jgi:hypothetical protein
MVAVLMITAGYMGAVSVVTTVKWFWFLFGMAMFLPVIYSLARTFRETVITRKDPEMIELYGKIAWLTIIMWSFYPVVWLFSEGFASFSVSFEVQSLSSCRLRCRAAVCPVQCLQASKFSGGRLSGAHCAMRTTPVATLRVVWDHRVQSLFGQKTKKKSGMWTQRIMCDHESTVSARGKE